MVKLVSFSPFKSQLSALENMNAISEGVMHEDLKKFLDMHVTNKENVILGVIDSTLSSEIKNKLSINCCSSNEVVSEVTRGLRVHFHKMVKGLEMKGEEKAQLGLSHSYSRSKLKFNVHRNDNMIIQSIALADQLDKDINTFSMRVKEWYSFHFPELLKIESDNYKYCRLVDAIGNCSNLNEEMIEQLEEITQDSEKANAIILASTRTMGMDISDVDLVNIGYFCKRVISLTQYKQSLTQYLHQRMNSVAPNLSALIGDVVGARLISHAGSLTNLAKYPASTVQILGAEKALFRALKKRGNTPKYGLIFHSTFIGRAGLKNKGRISRFLANKCSMASRIDCFTDLPSPIFGEKLKDQVEERLKFYEEGVKPRKNTEVMHEALGIYNSFVEEQGAAIKVEVEENKSVIGGSEKKKKKKKKSLATADMNGTAVVDEAPKSEKKKKKKSIAPEETNGSSNENVVEVPKLDKKKKKKKSIAPVESNESVAENVPETPKSEKKKKKKKSLAPEEVSSENVAEEPKSEKKKKRKKVDDSAEAATPAKKKKKQAA